LEDERSNIESQPICKRVVVELNNHKILLIFIKLHYKINIPFLSDMHLAVILVNLLFITKERNCMSEILLSDLKIGEQGIIHHFNDQNIALKLMEMGCLPGEEVTLERFAPMGDPIAIVVAGYSLSLRKSEASSVVLEQF